MTSPRAGSAGTSGRPLGPDIPARNALVTGITGQDGSYLAELLLSKGYRVSGLVLPGGREPLDNIRHLLDRLDLLEGDLTDQGSLDAAVRGSRPDEAYNLAAQSFVPLSWTKPVMTGEVTGLGAARLLEAVRRFAPKARFFQASSAEIFGNPSSSPQCESTPVRPKNPYGAAKAYAHFLAANYREQGLYACSGILFNHESPRRGPDFVTRKVTRAAARIKLGLEHQLKVGSLTARRDWGFAGDFVEAMWLMLQQEAPQDFVIATGRAHSVKDLLEAAFSAVGLDWRKHAVQDPALVRPDEPVPVVGDATKALEVLGWTPRVTFEEMISRMVAEDLRTLEAANTAAEANIP